MTKSAWFAVVAVWAAGFGSMGGLAYALNRPLTSPPPRPEPAALLIAAVPPAIELIPLKPALQQTIEMEAVQIIGYVPRLAPRVAAPPAARDYGVMDCSEWKELEQGSPHQRVQLCK